MSLQYVERPRRALVPASASHAVRFVLAEVLRLEQLGA
jgi:hypothetical protein